MLPFWQGMLSFGVGCRLQLTSTLHKMRSDSLRRQTFFCKGLRTHLQMLPVHLPPSLLVSRMTVGTDRDHTRAQPTVVFGCFSYGAHEDLMLSYSPWTGVRQLPCSIIACSTAQPYTEDAVSCLSVLWSNVCRAVFRSPEEGARFGSFSSSRGGASWQRIHS